MLDIMSRGLTNKEIRAIIQLKYDAAAIASRRPRYVSICVPSPSVEAPFRA